MSVRWAYKVLLPLYDDSYLWLCYWVGGLREWRKSGIVCTCAMCVTIARVLPTLNRVISEALMLTIRNVQVVEVWHGDVDVIVTLSLYAKRAGLLLFVRLLLSKERVQKGCVLWWVGIIYCILQLPKKRRRKTMSSPDKNHANI